MELKRRGQAFRPPLSSYGEFKQKEKHVPLLWRFAFEADRRIGLAWQRNLE
jgi:hypothetical protein